MAGDFGYRVTSGRDLALQVLIRVESKEEFVNLTLSRYLNGSGLTGRERALASELAYGTVTRLNTLDWQLSQFLTRPLEKLTVPVRNILRMGLYQLYYLKRVPSSAAVNESVKLAYRYGHKGVAGFVNAVLRRASQQKKPPWPDSSLEPLRYIALKHSHPLWMLDRWCTRFGFEETVLLCEANNRVPMLSIRVNTNKISASTLSRLLKKEGVLLKESNYLEEGLLVKSPRPLPLLSSFQKGFFTVQGESAMLASRALNPLPGERVVDLCSAPGGKAAHLAQLMEEQGVVIAGDSSAKRLSLLKDTIKRLQIRSIEIKRWDASDFSSNDVASVGLADRVILDAPCSGLGVICRKPDLKWRKFEEDLHSLAALQFKMLRTASSLLCPGGLLLYCVCTNEPEETDELIKKILEEDSSLSLTDITPYLPHSLQKDVFSKGMLHLYPHRHLADGFFMARIKKNS